MVVTPEAIKRKLSQPSQVTTATQFTSQPVKTGQAIFGPANPTSQYSAQPIESPGFIDDGSGQNKPYQIQPVGGGGSFPPADSSGRISHQSEVRSQADLPKYGNVDQFDFNRNYEDTLDQLFRQRSDLEQQNDLVRQRLQEDYGRQVRDVERAQQEALDLENERFAGQGILRSGIAVKSAGNVGARYGGELDQLQRGLSTQLEDREASYAQAQRQIQEQIGRAQEFATRQQQMIEEQRARQAAAAAAAQAMANSMQQQEKKPQVNVVRDNLGKYFIVDPTSQTRQQVQQNQLGTLNQLYDVNQINSMDQAAALFGGDYQTRAEALARRLGGNLAGTPSLDVRLGFRDLGAWRG